MRLRDLILDRIKMGCGISRFNLIEDGMACGGIKRRMVESRSKKDLLLDPSTTSTTKLLPKDGAAEDPHYHARKPSSDSVVMKEPPLQPQIIPKKERVEREKGECGLRGTEKEEGDETDDDEYERAAKDKDDNFAKRISDFDGNWIGSPSFKEYCVDSVSDKDVFNNGKGNGEDTEKKTRGTDNLPSSEEDCVVRGSKRLEKKGSRGKKLFPTMHKPRNLWHVTTCYSRNNHHVVTTEKLPEKV